MTYFHMLALHHITLALTDDLTKAVVDPYPLMH